MTQSDATLAAHARDFEFLAGRWTVRHERLKARLAGSEDWEVFPGTTEAWLTMGGFGIVDDNVLEFPSGTYRAMSVRAFNPETRQWAIWWLDARNPTSLGEPVFGAFTNGEGVFLGEDTFNGRPIKVRFRWHDISAKSARWEQAFSPDDGASWEVNWRMHFTRAA